MKTLSDRFCVNCLTVLRGIAASLALPLANRLLGQTMFRVAVYSMAIFASVAFSAKIEVNSTNVIHNLHRLATFNDLSPPSVQRILYTSSDVSARKYIQSLMEAAGLRVSHDAVGNIFGIWEGTTSLPGVLTGSHIDAIPHSGMYDGTLGVIGAIEAVLALRQSGFSPQRSITVVMFTSEEPTRFGLSCIGSRLLVNAVKTEELNDLTDETQTSFHAARKQAGYDGDIESVPLHASSFSAFVELHIEQADTLEKSGVNIGAVSHIAAPAAAKVTFTGGGGHAGSLLMKNRNDAGLAAAQLALVVEQAALERGEDSVATTGKLELFPGAVNSVPSMATMSIDVRDVDLEQRDSALEEIENGMRRIASERNVSAKFEMSSKDDPAVCDSRIVNMVLSVAKQLGLSAKRMVSRAYHDALFMAKSFPTAMIFVPCRDGVSHRPDEFVQESDVHNGVAVLAGVLQNLAGEERKEL
eukprot:TRINITY_DN80716_c0_g1_i1.p1 TRINITY_DN80716_c0_g1~~TRINITY_DN80716_c0_g1_i1.p1  ORF type:complete len:470 (-),score=59.48 TRINITY_DN80716_c0_g1_i1:364-1773(-)